MASMIKDRPIVEELKKAFKRYDEDDRGLITYENLCEVAHTLEDEAHKKGENFQEVSEKEIRWMLRLADRNSTMHAEP